MEVTNEIKDKAREHANSICDKEKFYNEWMRAYGAYISGYCAGLRANEPNLQILPKDTDYTQGFIDWRNRFFEYKPKELSYRTKSKHAYFTIDKLHKRYKKAMLESPFKQ